MTDWVRVIHQIAPAAHAPIVSMIADRADEQFAKRNIRSIRRQASILAHMAVETWNFTALEENLNYSSAARLCKVWPKRFPTVESAQRYVHNPEALAIKVYGDRMGNHAGSRDGWTFRGKGLLQCTGRENTENLARELGITPEQAAAWLIDPEHALECACVLYNILNVGPAADKGDIVTETKRVNGGTNGLSERKAAFNRAMRALSTQTAPKAVNRTRGAESDGDAALDNVSAQDLRNAGSRTIQGADQVKHAVSGLVTSGGTAVAMISQANDVAQQASSVVSQTTDAIEGVKTHATLLQTFAANWPVVILIIATLAALFFAWRAWQAAHLITEARVDDTRTGANIGR